MRGNTRIQTPDLGLNSVGNSALMDGIVTLSKVQIQNSTIAVTAQNLPMSPSSLTPTIAQEINNLTNNQNLSFCYWTSGGNNGLYVFNNLINTLIIHWVIVNNQMQKEGYDYNIITSSNGKFNYLSFTYIVENGLRIYAFYQNL